jgi:putative ATP-binding cassette transporter
MTDTTARPAYSRSPSIDPVSTHTVPVQAASKGGAIRDAWRLARGWGRAEPWTVAALVGAGFGFIALQLAVDWGFALWNRAAFDALEARDGAGFAGQMLVFGALILGMMLASVGRLWSRQVIAFRWRRWLVLRLQGGMLAEGAHHRLATEASGTDNPDQRIGENTRWATAIAVDLALGLIYAAVLLVSFTGMLWHLSTGFFVPLPDGGTLPIPGGMLWAALVYAGACAAVTWRLGRALPSIHMQRNAAEGDHRFALVRPAREQRGHRDDRRRGRRAPGARPPPMAGSRGRCCACSAPSAT